jgi:HKD family nuclease
VVEWRFDRLFSFTYSAKFQITGSEYTTFCDGKMSRRARA